METVFKKQEILFMTGAVPSKAARACFILPGTALYTEVLMKLRKTLCFTLALALAASTALCALAAAPKESTGSTFASELKELKKEENKTSDSASSDEIPEKYITVTWNDSRVYHELTLGKYKIVKTYGVKGYEDVPFLSAEDYLGILCEGRARTAFEDGVMTVSINNTTVTIDSKTDTITFENPARFRSDGNVNGARGVDGAIVEEQEYNVITRSVRNKSVQSKAAPLTVHLADYHMPVIPYKDTVLVPFLALQNTFGSAMMSTVLAYNGKDYFNSFEANNFALEEGHEAAKESPYMKAICSGPFSELTETTQAYADYGYYSVCLLLDLTFGHKQEKNITTFDEYFTRMNAKASMRSTDPSSAMLTEFLLFNYLFDSGHDSIMTPDNVFGANASLDIANTGNLAEDVISSQETREMVEKQKEAAKETDQEAAANALLGALMEKGLKFPEVASLLYWTATVDKVRPENYGNERLDYAGDTAVIYFKAFNDDTHMRTPSYYLDPIREDDISKNTFAFFYQCFEDIKKHDKVKNVVINLADNGGGSAAALISVLGFLSPDGEVRITDQDLLAGNYREEWYHVDTNLDGISDDEDGYGGQYDFYILSSGSAYSCGNALPYFAQKEGLAKIMGAKPGGGDCVVGAFIDAYGRCAAYSGMLKLGTDDGSGFVSNEKATTLDLNMVPTIWDISQVPWFDPEAIADAVNEYRKGVTEISYNQKDEAEKIAEVIGSILESLTRGGDDIGGESESGSR